MHPVESSYIKSIGHKGEVMHVIYKNDERPYAFTGITAEDFRKLRAAKSIGHHLAIMNVKGKRL